MDNFESGEFTYSDLKEGEPLAGSEQSIATGVVINSENPLSDTEISKEIMFDGLAESGVEVEPFEPFYADGTTPEQNTK